MKKIFEKTLKSGQTVKGKVLNMEQLSAGYQIWVAEAHGLTDKESLACWISNEPDMILAYEDLFESADEVERLAKIGFEKSVGDIPCFL